MTTLILLKADQLGLFDTPTYVDPHTRKDGTFVHGHMSRRKRRTVQASSAPPHAGAPKMEAYIKKHGGADALRATIEGFSPDQRAKILDAIGGLDGVGGNAVAQRLGLHVNESAKTEQVGADTSKGEARLARLKQRRDPEGRGDPAMDDVERRVMATPTVTEPAKDMVEEHERLVQVLESPSHEDDKAEAKKQAAELQEYREVAAGEAEPKEGDRKTENGVEYVLRDGRWHRAMTEAEEMEAADDRADLADALARDPHSDESKAMLAKIAAKNAPPPAVEPAVHDDLDPSSPNYRYRDTGYVGGSRKEMAAMQIRNSARAGRRVRVTDVDWDALEENPREAKELVTKQNLFGDVDWQALADGGMDPGAGFLASKIYAAVGTEPPEDNPTARHNFALAITTLRDRVEATKSAADMIALVDEMREERDGVLLNVEEQAAYNEAMAAANAAFRKVKEIDRQADELYKRYSAANRAHYDVSADAEKRKRRGWKVAPDVEERAAAAKAEAEAAEAAWRDFRNKSGMEPIVTKQTSADGRSVTSRFKYAYKAEWEEALSRVAEIKRQVKARNYAENPMVKAWYSLGPKFQAVLDYRSKMKGSDAFGKHVATVKNDRVTSWDWAAKKTDPKGVSKRGTVFQLFVADSIERKGGPSVDVHSTASLKEVFGLREVQSGNWVLDDPVSAKFHVEACAGAFADLADLLGVPPAQISFNGRLAMAFGARGKGGAKAHYEPVHRIINMTKMAGAGSLAHEWFHAIDNMVKEAVSGVPAGVDDFATEAPGIVDDPDISAAFRDLAKAMHDGPHRQIETLYYTETEERWAAQNMSYGLAGGVRGAIQRAGSMQAAVDAVEDAYQRGQFGAVGKKRAKNTRDNWRKIALIHHGKNPERKIQYGTGPSMSTFMLDAIELDKGQTGKYWSSGKEMAARAFAGYVEDKLKAAGRVNTYLVSQGNNAAYKARGVAARPYPDGAERQAVNAAFDRLMKLLAERDVLAKAAMLFDAPAPMLEVVTA